MNQSIEAEANNTHFPWISIGFTAITIALFIQFGAIPQTLIYNREAILAGEVWRLITGHFVHCDLSHLTWNVIALLSLGFLLERRVGEKLMTVTILSCIGVSAWLWLFKPDLANYCGLSGMLNGLLVVLLAILWQETKSPIVPLIALSAILKISFESMTGQALFANPCWEAVPGAHGAGIVAGVIYLFTAVLRKNDQGVSSDEVYFS